MSGAGRTIVVGDLHGCLDELEDLLSLARFGARDRVVCVGDLVTKGPRSRDVLELFIRDARFSSVLGNHDRAVGRALRGKGLKKLKSAQAACVRELERSADAARYSEYLRALPLYKDLGSHVVVHAGLRPGVPLAEQKKSDLTELRTLGRHRTNRKGTPWYEVYDGGPVALFGHWPAPEPRRGPRALGLDTGCVYGHRLTAYVVEEGRLLSVAARRPYSPR